MTTKELIAFVMDMADIAQKVKDEVRGLRASRRIITEEENEALTEFLLESVTDLEIAETDLGEYSRMGFVSKSFAVAENQSVE